MLIPAAVNLYKHGTICVIRNVKLMSICLQIDIWPCTFYSVEYWLTSGKYTFHETRVLIRKLFNFNLLSTVSKPFAARVSMIAQMCQ